MKHDATFCSFLLILFSISCNITATNETEYNVGDILDTIGEAAGSILDLLTDSENCAFECPRGQLPVPRVGHKPSTNGCGSHGFKLDTSLLPQMTECCNNHDMCYDSCNSDKNDCDDEFRDCLEDMCSELMDGLSDEDFDGCSGIADIMYATTLALGCKPYRTAQKDACVCVTDDTGKQGRKQYTKKKNHKYNDEL